MPTPSPAPLAPIPLTHGRDPFQPPPHPVPSHRIAPFNVSPRQSGWFSGKYISGVLARSSQLAELSNRLFRFGLDMVCQGRSKGEAAVSIGVTPLTCDFGLYL